MLNFLLYSYQFTYRENKIMKAELQNMYILNEENKDLKEELLKYKSISYDERMKSMNEENQSMKIRIGQLLERIHDLETRTHEVEASTTENELSKFQNTIEHNVYPIRTQPLERPSTAQVRTNQGFDPLLEKVEKELDLDIQAMLERNQKLLSEMKEDVQELPEG